MFKKTNVKIIGIIENMTSFTSEDGMEHFIFGKDGGKNIAERFDIELLGQIPIDIKIRENSDDGLPFMENNIENKISNIFRNISKKIVKLLI
jgi:ATP-binding protein involved in chromosome partitioning